MDWTINGLPLHPLLIHATVVLVPLAAVAATLGTLWPAARKKLGIVTPIIATIAAAAMALTIEAGEWLKEHVVTTDLVEAHIRIGKTAVPWILLLVASTWLQWAWFAYGKKRFPDASKAVPIVLASLVMVGAVGSTVAIIVIADAGAKAVWTDLTIT